MTTAGKTWRKRKRERPDEIRAAAMIEFSRLGAGAVTMEKIASRAGVTKGTIYLYYESKSALFDAAGVAAVRNGIRWQIGESKMPSV